MATIPSSNHDQGTAVGIALSTFLDAETTAEALHLWEEKYASQKKFSVQYFARECCTRFVEKEAERSKLVKSLVRELYIQLHTLDQIQLDKE